ncbi:hypothetical protein AAFF_G00251120 [Aldrovandia affinis]|uniref:Uncharacterized protein n=1 Tax=Aldrovandia affinis TaxID=143900 RepID=A0AAD7RD96_9TELE|nr:hypothetical protein AAFF_G00251120 [Aldrovandia affinis]
MRGSRGRRVPAGGMGVSAREAGWRPAALGRLRTAATPPDLSGGGPDGWIIARTHAPPTREHGHSSHCAQLLLNGHTHTPVWSSGAHGTYLPCGR